MKGSVIVLVILLAFVALFSFQNPEVVTVRFLGFTGDTLLLAVVVAAFGAGVFGAGLAALPGHFRRRSEAKAAKQKNKELEAEVKALKTEVEQLRKDAAARKGKELPNPGGLI